MRLDSIFRHSVIAAFCSLIPAVVMGQTASTGGVSNADTIDGAKTPEAIPDQTAYRLLFRAFSESPTATPEERARQRIKLAPIGLSSSDLDAFFKVLNLFHTQQAEFQARYEAAMKKDQAANKPTDHSIFMAERDGLVSDIRTRISESLTEDGRIRLESFMRSEKRHMTIAHFR